MVWGGPSPPALARRVGCLEGLGVAQTVRCWLELGWRRPRGAGSIRWRRGVGTRGSLDPCRDVPLGACDFGALVWHVHNWHDGAREPRYGQRSGDQAHCEGARAVSHKARGPQCHESRTQ